MLTAQKDDWYYDIQIQHNYLVSSFLATIIRYEKIKTKTNIITPTTKLQVSLATAILILVF